MTFSERLRQQRLSRGIDLGQIAADTKISKRYLEALESGDLKSIPGAIFARSFARQYARHVGLDEALIEDEIQAAFQQEDPFKVEPSNPALTPAQPASHQHNSLLSRIEFDWQRVPVPSLTLVAVLGACAMLYMGWQRVVLGKGESSSPLASAPALPNPFAGAPSTKLPVAESLPRPGVAAVPGMMPAGTMADGQNAALELEVPQSGGPGMKIAVVASQQTWVSITANGKTVYTGILEPNSTRVLKGVERAKMVIGNAGGVEVLTDDRTIGPIGPQGQVRVVLLSPDGPKIMKTAEERQAPAGGSTDAEASAGSNKVAL